VGETSAKAAKRPFIPSACKALALSSCGYLLDAAVLEFFGLLTAGIAFGILLSRPPDRERAGE
jgi:hypothetical protein